MDQPPHSGGGSSAQPSKMELLDAPLHKFGFELDEISAGKISGHLLVTPKCCQPFGRLHGGVSAMIAEALASIGAHVASGFQRVAGLHLSIHHLKSTKTGDCVVAEATPVNIAKTIQVWEVRLWKCDTPDSENKKILIASARVTVFCNFTSPESSKDVAANFKRYAKL